MAQVAKLVLDDGLERLHCPVCGQALCIAGEGLADSFCDHLIAIVDWVDEVIDGPAGETWSDQIEDLVQDEAPENLADAIGKVLPPTALVLDFTEPARGGGHTGSHILFALEFAPRS